MTCCGDKRNSGKTPSGHERTIKPEDPCVACAEKHLSFSYSLALEHGYGPINRQRIIGELCACASHLWTIDIELTEKIRFIRLLIQQRREAEVDWHPALTAMDALVIRGLPAESPPTLRAGPAEAI